MGVAANEPAVRTEPRSASYPQREPAPQWQAGHVLVVDDDPDILRMIRGALDDEGYHVITATDGLQALDRLQAALPAVILLDLTMPIMNGWQLNDRLHELGLDVPVVFMTAAFRARAEAEAHGAAGFLAKPFDIDDLLDTVARFATPQPG